ncbi:MAG: hypothetical protein QQN63_13965, partial [Nitrosopumilus sp.]
MKNATSIGQEIAAAILAGKETKESRIIRRNPWESLEHGMQFLEGIHQAYGELGKERRTNRKQRDLLNLYRDRLRETTLSLTPEQLMEVCGMLMLDVNRIVDLPSYAFNTKDGEIDKAVRIVQLITEARLLMPPFSDESDDTVTTATENAPGLGIVFGTLLLHSQFKVSSTWQNFINAVIQKNPQALKSWQIIMFSNDIQSGFAVTEESEAFRRRGPKISLAGSMMSLDALNM